MAARIELVEREFIIVTAAESHNLARIQAPGRIVCCPLASADRQLVRFAPKNGEAETLKAWERVHVYFDFRGQNFVFESMVRKSGPGLLELSYPESMYRGLSRRWPRVRPPRELALDFIFPDSALDLPCPLSREYVEVDLPPSRGGLKTESLASLIASFKTQAAELCDDSRVVMFREDRKPSDFAEELVAQHGRAIFLPSVLGSLPLIDPYPEGRLLTRAVLESRSEDFGLGAASRFESFVAQKGGEGIQAALWCPIGYYRYTIGFAYLANNRDSRRPFDFRLLDFTWDFTRLLAWFLKRHGYFDNGSPAVAPRRGAIMDASATGLLVGLGAGQPQLKEGAKVELLLSIGRSRHPCVGRIARRFEKEGRSYYGLALDGMDEATVSLLSQDLYGEGASSLEGLGA